MITVIMTTPGVPGDTTLIFNEVNSLVEVRLPQEPGAVAVSAIETLLRNIPATYEKLPAFRAFAHKSTFTETHTKITFQMMWDRYNDKDRSSKKKSQIAWDKLPESEQVKAYLYYPQYNRNRGTAEKKYLETYFNAQLWNN